MPELRSIVLLLGASLVLTGCPEEKKTKKEKIGDKIEDKADKAGDKLENAGDKVEDKLDD